MALFASAPLLFGQIVKAELSDAEVRAEAKRYGITTHGKLPFTKRPIKYVKEELFKKKEKEFYEFKRQQSNRRTARERSIVATTENAADADRKVSTKFLATRDEEKKNEFFEKELLLKKQIDFAKWAHVTGRKDEARKQLISADKKSKELWGETQEGTDERHEVIYNDGDILEIQGAIYEREKQAKLKLKKEREQFKAELAAYEREQAKKRKAEAAAAATALKNMTPEQREQARYEAMTPEEQREYNLNVDALNKAHEVYDDFDSWSKEDRDDFIETFKAVERNPDFGMTDDGWRYYRKRSLQKKKQMIEDGTTGDAGKEDDGLKEGDKTPKDPKDPKTPEDDDKTPKDPKEPKTTEDGKEGDDPTTSTSDEMPDDTQPSAEDGSQGGDEGGKSGTTTVDIGALDPENYKNSGPLVTPDGNVYEYKNGKLVQTGTTDGYEAPEAPGVTDTKVEDLKGELTTNPIDDNGSMTGSGAGITGFLNGFNTTTSDKTSGGLGLIKGQDGIQNATGAGQGTVDKADALVDGAKQDALNLKNKTANTTAGAYDDMSLKSNVKKGVVGAITKGVKRTGRAVGSAAARGVNKSMYGDDDKKGKTGSSGKPTGGKPGGKPGGPGGKPKHGRPRDPCAPGKPCPPKGGGGKPPSGGVLPPSGGGKPPSGGDDGGPGGSEFDPTDWAMPPVELPPVDLGLNGKTMLGRPIDPDDDSGGLPPWDGDLDGIAPGLGDTDPGELDGLIDKGKEEDPRAGWKYVDGTKVETLPDGTIRTTITGGHWVDADGNVVDDGYGVPLQ